MEQWLKKFRLPGWELADRLFWWTVVPISLLTLVTAYFSLWDGAGYNDEAWLALMVQHQQNGFWTSFARYYGLIRNWGLMEMRLFVALFHGGAFAVFVWGCVRYFRPFADRVLLRSVGLWMVGALLPNLFWLGGVCLAPDYKFAAFDCALIGMGLFYLGLERPLLMTVSGAFFIQILFVLPQVGLLAPLLLLIAFLRSPSRLGWFVLGGLAGIAVFLFGISSWNDFLQCITYSGARIAVNDPSRHGTAMLMTGYLKIIAEFAAVVFPAALALEAARRSPRDRRRTLTGLVLLCLLAAFLLRTLRVLSWKDGGCPACSITVFPVLFSALLARDAWEDSGAEKRFMRFLLTSLFLVMPVIFCTGTDKGFENRLTFYIGTLLVGAVVLIYRLKDRLMMTVLTGFLALAFLAGLVFWKQTANFRMLPGTANAQSYGFACDAPVSPEMAAHLKALRQYTDRVGYIVNDPLHWYVPFLLRKEPACLQSFRYYSFDDIGEILKRRGIRADEVIFLESPEYALSAERLEAIRKQLSATRIERTELSPGHHILRFVP